MSGVLLHTTRNYFESSFRIKALGHPDIPRMKKYFAKNVEYIWRWQSNCMHPLYGEVVIGKGKLKTFSETRKNSHFQRIFLNLDITPHGSWTCIERKKNTHSNFCYFRSKNVNRNRFQEIKIGPWEGFEKKAFFSLFLMRK